MEATAHSLFKGLDYFESLLPDFAKTGLFSRAGQRYTKGQNTLYTGMYRPVAKVIETRRETDETTTFVLLPTAANYPQFTAGQHIDVAVSIKGVRQVRQYSLTGATNSIYLQITVKRQKGGLVSNYLLDTIQTGDLIEISAPRGDFGLRSSQASSYLFFSAGSGITPVFAMARELLRAGAWGEIHFFHATASRASLIFADELLSLAAEHDNFHLHLFFSNDEGKEKRRLDAAAAALALRDFPHNAQSPVYLCGPGEFVESLKAGLGELQYTNISTEYYTLPKASAGEGSAIFTRSSVTQKSTANLLETAEAAGLKPKHGCRRGICHECKAHKLSGTVRNVLNGKETTGKEDIQLCITQPVGVVEIEL